MENDNKIALIGDGFITELIVSSSFKQLNINPYNYYVYSEDAPRLTELRESYGVNILKNLENLSDFEHIILALYPNQTNKILPKIKKFVPKDARIFSWIYGLNISELKKFFPTQSVIRGVFTPVLISGYGVFSYFLGNVNSVEVKNFVETLLERLGKTIKVNSEDELNTIGEILLSETVATYLMVNSMIDGAIKAGLSRETSIEIAAKIVGGTIKTFTDADAVIEHLISRAAEEKYMQDMVEDAKKIINKLDMWNFAKENSSAEPENKKLLRFHYHW